MKKPTGSKKSKAKKVAKKVQPEKIEAIEDENQEIVFPEIDADEIVDINPIESKSSDEDSKALSTSDPVALYMHQVKKYPVLSKEDEHKIAVQYRETKDPQLAEILVTSNLRFVVKVAAEYAKYGAKLIDLVQEGNVGLMHAVKEYNPYKGARLITYAVWWIRGYIQEYLMRQYSMVRIGTTQAQRKLFYQLQKQKEALERMGEQEVVKQLSGKLGVSEKDVESMSQRMSGRDVSLDAPVGEGGQSQLLDFQSDGSEELDQLLGHLEQIKILKDKIDNLRDSLNERELELLDDRVLADDPLTLQEIGEKYGVSREAVRQMEARLIKKIRQQMTPDEDSDPS